MAVLHVGEIPNLREAGLLWDWIHPKPLFLFGSTAVELRAACNGAQLMK